MAFTSSITTPILRENLCQLASPATSPRRSPPTCTKPRQWRSSDDDKRDAEAAKAERLRDEGIHMVGIGWGGDGRTIEHDTSPEPPNKGLNPHNTLMKATPRIAVVR
jgi:hypothetical protein